MVNKFIYSLVIFLSTITSDVSWAGTLPEQWVGSYSYQYVMGHAAGDPAPAWVFDLKVKADGSCELSWQGYQKDDDILCQASADSANLKIFFVNFYNGEASYPDDYRPYKSGEKLLELKMVDSTGKIWTKWGVLNKGGVLKDGVRFSRD